MAREGFRSNEAQIAAPEARNNRKSLADQRRNQNATPTKIPAMIPASAHPTSRARPQRDGKSRTTLPPFARFVRLPPMKRTGSGALALVLESASQASAQIIVAESEEILQ